MLTDGMVQVFGQNRQGISMWAMFKAGATP
jgi:hypothetical protein